MVSLACFCFEIIFLRFGTSFRFTYNTVLYVLVLIVRTVL